MSISLLKALARYYNPVEPAAVDTTVDAPPELDFMPEPGDDDLGPNLCHFASSSREPPRTQEGSDQYKLKVVDKFYGGLSYSELNEKRISMVVHGIDLAYEPAEWIPELRQLK